VCHVFHSRRNVADQLKADAASAGLRERLEACKIDDNDPTTISGTDSPHAKGKLLRRRANCDICVVASRSVVGRDVFPQSDRGKRDASQRDCVSRVTDVEELNSRREMQSRCIGSRRNATRRASVIEASIVPLNRRKLVRLIRYIRDEHCFFSARLADDSRDFLPNRRARTNTDVTSLVKSREVAPSGQRSPRRDLAGAVR